MNLSAAVVFQVTEAATGGVLKKFTKFLRLATSLKKRLQHRCFPVNFVKFLKTPFLHNTPWRLLLKLALTLFA